MRITSANLDETISMIKWRSLPIEEQALEILKEHDLIEIPIPDENWGGAIRKFHNEKRLPIINTAQPRLYQYFIYWHEIYHLTEHEEKIIHNQNYEILTDFNLSERKADYFASQMIFRYQDLYE
jgi:Zn-dependent peptidase ImmA (M78 family)